MPMHARACTRPHPPRARTRTHTCMHTHAHGYGHAPAPRRNPPPPHPSRRRHQDCRHWGWHRRLEVKLGTAVQHACCGAFAASGGGRVARFLAQDQSPRHRHSTAHTRSQTADRCERGESGQNKACTGNVRRVTEEGVKSRHGGGGGRQGRRSMVREVQRLPPRRARRSARRSTAVGYTARLCVRRAEIEPPAPRCDGKVGQGQAGGL